ncbi:MAG: hypothetical protein M5U19_07585 [Microthrixaceae bacterium]|nr:hypothetical protein [Microthrixaceae bacterium]
MTSAFADATWAALERGADRDPPSFDHATLADLLVRRRGCCRRRCPTGCRCMTSCASRCAARSSSRRWLGFTAEQILRRGGVRVGSGRRGRLVRFVGADALGPDGARIEFRLHGRIPVVRGAGPDIARSAHGRLAAETVAWLPSALTPQAGAVWRALDDHRAVVTLTGPGEPTDVEVTVDAAGAVTSLALSRWKDSAKPPAFAPFGGTVDSVLTTREGIRVAGSGTVGWDWGTPAAADGSFFRYEITRAELSAPVS